MHMAEKIKHVQNLLFLVSASSTLELNGNGRGHISCGADVLILCSREQKQVQ